MISRMWALAVRVSAACVRGENGDVDGGEEGGGAGRKWGSGWGEGGSGCEPEDIARSRASRRAISARASTRAT